MYRHKGVTYIEIEEDVEELQEMDVLLVFCSPATIAEFFNISRFEAGSVYLYLTARELTMTESAIEFKLKEDGII